MTRVFPRPTNRSKPAGVALIIVLAFVVLLAGITVAYLSRASTDREVAQASFNDWKADQLARSALDVIVGDLKQEIADGSISSTVNGFTICIPTSAVNIRPMCSGNPEPIPNLVRRSVQPDPIAPPGVPSRASAITSAPIDPANPKKGEISAARWNKHYLIPKSNPNDEQSDPISSFVAPDWVLVTRSGPQSFTAWNASLRDVTSELFAVGRYAYAIYDEGGILDVNVAGYPTDATQPGTIVATDAPVGSKGFLALADLVPVVPANTIPEQRAAINKIVGWRNHATAFPSGTFPNFTFTAASGSIWYANFVAANTTGFLKTSTFTSSGRFDQSFVSRQELIEYRASAQFSINALQYLGTFSRELDNPTWADAVSQRVTSAFPRRDGTTAQPGEPLFRRFPVAEIAWLGPNGILVPGTIQLVQRDFGLVWNVDHWDYYGSGGTGLASAIPPITGDREPEFFQLLALAKPAASIQQILTTGACLIDQYDGPTTDSANTTTRIDYAGPPMPPSPTNSVAWGMENRIPPLPAAAPTPNANPTPIILNRPFQNVGEFGYAYRDVTLASPAPTPRTLDFYTSTSADAAILDLFGMSAVPKRAGIINLNTRQDLVLRSVLSFATVTAPSTAISSARRNLTATGLVNATAATPATSRQDLARLAAQSGITGGEEVQEVVARALSDTGQTRTWNLMIDAIAQSGRYPPPATNLSDFVVEGEKRYWLHVAIDRFTGEVIDQQLELVNE